MSLAPHRLLGFAFASADLLVEVSGDDRINFAVGAVNTLAGGNEQALMGRSWKAFVDPRDAPLIDALFDGLDGASRSGPVIARKVSATGAKPEAFALSACRLPQNEGMISCALTRASADGLPTDPSGLHGRAAFELVSQGLFQTASANGQALELALVDMQGLQAAREKLSPDEARALDMRVGGAVRAQSHGGAAATALSEERFALVRQAGGGAAALAGKIAKLISVDGPDLGITPLAQALGASAENSPGQMVRAIRYALDDFIRDGVRPGETGTLADAVSRSVRDTLAKADALANTVAERRFRLVFQPVVHLKTGALHHHEVLVRFGDNASPFPMIRMAEELDLIEGLDLAIAEQAIGEMAADRSLSLAVNISGRTISSDSFMPAIVRMTETLEGIKGRLMFEVTESAAIPDLQFADRQIQELRRRGFAVCLDDFGAGAASLAYLQQLRLDVVKIDGAYVRDLQHGGRESAFIKHLVTMCQELKVKTLAEMVETSTVEDAVRRAGVDYGQGYHYGAPADRPEQPLTKQAKPAARRMGAVESWG